MISDELTQLVFHTLAHVPLVGPGDTHDPRYVAWAAGRLDAADEQLLIHDAALLARLWNADSRYQALHGMCDLYGGLAGLRACSDRPLVELRRDEVADPELLVAIRELPGAEVLHATLGLLATRFVRMFAELRPALEHADASVRVWLDRLDDACPGLAASQVELVWALGLHGRACEGRILVGAPAEWNGCSPARQAILAAHEHTVARLGGDYVAGEWAALTELADRLRTADAALRDVHRGWLASLDLSPLLAAAVERGYLSAAEGAKIDRDAANRPARLSAARAGA